MADKMNTPNMSGEQPKQPKALDEQGSIGKQFTEHGAMGGMAQKVGGPFDKEGMIGKQFTSEGMLGGTVQKNMGGEKDAPKK